MVVEQIVTRAAAGERQTLTHDKRRSHDRPPGSPSVATTRLVGTFLHVRGTRSSGRSPGGTETPGTD